MSEPVAIAFSKTGEAAKINYSIPMPGAHTGRRIIELDLGLAPSAFTDAAKTAGEDLAAKAGLKRSERGTEIDPARARLFFSHNLARAGVAVAAEALGRETAAAAASTATERLRSGVAERAMTEPIAATAVAFRRSAAPLSAGARLDEVQSDYKVYEEQLALGNVLVPVANWAGVPILVPRPADPAPEPTFFLVERYGISSFLGDYGMGRTVKTFTLLPGESTTISLKTWQSTTESIKESSSIIDSHEQSARERFADKVQSETTDKQTQSKTEKWHVEAEAKASWGFGSAKVSGGASGEYQSGREQFARQASEATQEHAAEASSKRELSVTSSSEKTVTSGSEALIERTITNVNVRRVLNFVFRELNQTYTTKLHLKEVRVAFSNGRLNSWREVPLSGLRRLLEETLQPSEIDTVAQRILKAAGVVFDSKDNAVVCLERVTIAADGTSISAELASTGSDGEFPPPGDRTYYRFRRGPLNQADANNPVDGVVLSEQQITMRTDSVIVEALLGQADALDAYAMEIQAAAASEKTLANRRTELVLDTLAAISNAEMRAELGARLLGTCCPKSE